MQRFHRSHFANDSLIAHAHASFALERGSTADLLADLGEIDLRRLYIEAGYPSLLAWCRWELRMAEQAALKRIRAARVCRDYPALFWAVADGRLHLTAVVLLKPHLTPENVEELIGAAAGRTQEEIRTMLVVRFPRPGATGSSQGLVERVLADTSVAGGTAGAGADEVSVQTVEEGAGGQAPPLELSVQTPVPAPWIGRTRLTPLSADAFDLQVTIGRDTRELLRRAQDLLGHQLPHGAVAEVLDRALQHYVRHLEKRKFGRTDRPRRRLRTGNQESRYIPAEVRRIVAERDRCRCTYTSESGKRCEATHALDYDHIVPYARGGTTTADNLRLRCRTHNQFEAERTYGAAFIKSKREQARQGRAKPREKVAPDPERDVRPWLRSLGIRVQDAERAAEYCETLGDAALAERVKAALAFLVPAHRRPVTSHLPPADPPAGDANAA